MNFESRNPATGELRAVHPEHDKAEIDARSTTKQIFPHIYLQSA
jgi:hypothetical protein